MALKMKSFNVTGFYVVFQIGANFGCFSTLIALIQR